MGGWGTSDDVTDALNAGQNFYKNWGGDWAVWGGASYQFNEKAALNVQASYDDAETLGLVANVAYTVVPGFVVTTEVDYRDTAAGDDSIGGILRFQRSF
jgi:hypothetical protein